QPPGCWARCRRRPATDAPAVVQAMVTMDTDHLGGIGVRTSWHRRSTPPRWSPLCPPHRASTIPLLSSVPTTRRATATVIGDRLVTVGVDVGRLGGHDLIPGQT